MDILYKIFIDPFVQMGGAPDLLIQTLWEGLVSGVLYALIALGFVLIFKASGVFNFAQGAMVLLAGSRSCARSTSWWRRACLFGAPSSWGSLSPPSSWRSRLG